MTDQTHETVRHLVYAVAFVVGAIVVFGGAAKCHGQMQVNDKLRIEAYSKCVEVTQVPERCRESSHSASIP